MNYFRTVAFGWSISEHSGFLNSRSKRIASPLVLPINVIQDPERLRAELTFDPPRTIEMARELDQIGYLKPSLIKSSDPRLIQDQTGRTVLGRLEKYWQSGFDRISIAGWACAPGGLDPPDAVFLSYDDQDGNPVIFAQAVMGERPDLVRREGRNELLWSGWQFDLLIDRVPPVRPAVKINAWVLDLQTATAVKLEGEAILALGPNG